MKNLCMAVLACFVLAVPVAATVLVPVDLAELAQEATVIARGQVVAVDGRWTDGRRGIETVITLETEAMLKGQAGGIVQFRVPGGTLGRYRNIVIGAPQFTVGQRLIVFLGATGPEVPHLLGLSQGVYRIGTGASGAELVAPSPVMPGVTGPVVRGASSRQPAPLADFERDVRTLARAAR